MKRKIALLLIVISAFFISAAQILFKFGSNIVSEKILNLPLVSGFCIYGLSALFVMISLKGNDLTFIYPFITTSYIWVLIMSSYFFNEIITLHKILGISLIIVGIIVISKGDRINSLILKKEQSS